jgi:carbamoyltransferase
MYILGLNAYHGDSSACIIKDGVLVAAIEEERLRRVKHWAGLPIEAIRFCLDYAGIGFHEVDFIAIGRDPKAHLEKKLLFTVTHLPSARSLVDRAKNLFKVGGLAEELAKAFPLPETIPTVISNDSEKSNKKDEISRPARNDSPYAADIRKKIVNVEHHKAHLASAFFVSPFDESAVLSVDGMGDFTSTMWGMGRGNRMEILGTVHYPHSLGFLYTAITQYLGFQKYGDEYKVMGLSGFGKPEYLTEFRQLIHLKSEGMFELNLEYFTHHAKGVAMTWEGGEPVIGTMYSGKLVELFGPARKYEEPLTPHHENIAASLQAIYEEVLFHILNHLAKVTGADTICFAGGTAQNSLANGKIRANTPFKNIYIPPAGHDAGTAIGAAYFAWNELQKRERGFVMKSPFWGAGHSDKALMTALDAAGLDYERLEDEALYRTVATLVAEGNIVGWFQGRTEWGPRALGNRSIVANPAFPEIKERMNVKIKKREPFRPFAPSILEERVGDFFEQEYPVPFMEKVYAIRKEVQSKIPAVVHVDGTGRLQSVSRDVNERYYRLIEEVGKVTGIPIVLNTSFNENEPIVNKPEEAIDCYLRTKMDVLVLGNYIVRRER